MTGMKQAKRVLAEMTDLLADQIHEVKKHGPKNVSHLFGQVISTKPTAALGWAIAGRRAGTGAAIGAIVGGLLFGTVGAAVGGAVGGGLGAYSGAQRALRVW